MDLTIGEKIKKIRKEKGLTQQELADILGVSKATVAMYEINRNQPNLIILKKICLIFDISGNYLLGLTDKAISLKVAMEKEKNFATEIATFLSPFPKYDLLEIRAALKLFVDGVDENIWGKYSKKIFHLATHLYINIGGIIDNYRAIAAAPKSTNFNKSLYHSIGVMTLDINADLGELIKLLQKASLEIQTTEENRQAIEKLIEIKRAKDKA